MERFLRVATRGFMVFGAGIAGNTRLRLRLFNPDLAKRQHSLNVRLPGRAWDGRRLYLHGQKGKQLAGYEAAAFGLGCLERLQANRVIEGLCQRDVSQTRESITAGGIKTAITIKMAYANTAPPTVRNLPPVGRAEWIMRCVLITQKCFGLTIRRGRLIRNRLI